MKNSKLTELLEKVFDEISEAHNLNEYNYRKQDFVFHMTDWKNDLETLSKIYANPEKYDDDTAKVITSFLYHVIPHLNMAGHLLLDVIPNPFEE